MFGDLMKGFIDTEEITRTTIQESLRKIQAELGCSHKEMFVMIKPSNENCDFRCWIYKISDGQPELVREITLAEILGK